MKNKNLKSEIKGLLSNVEKVLGKDSIQYQKLDYILDILVTVYECNYDSVNGHLKTGTFGHEKSSTKSWKLIPPLHQSDLVEPNGCEFGSCHRAG